MGNKARRSKQPIPSRGAAPRTFQVLVPPHKEQVRSLLDRMTDDNEYGSIVSLNLQPDVDVVNDVARALAQIEAIRGRPCIAYLGNVIKPDGSAGVDATDDLPFAELVNSIPAQHRSVDVFLSTLGGSGQQIVRFVAALRARFDDVQFLIPSMCMSAGTLFALSGDEIWMNPQACLGPIDPQVPTKDGRFVPAQALLLLVNEVQKQGQDAIDKGQSPPWSAIRIIDTIDKKELGDAMTASHYSINMAKQFLNDYKFRNWTRTATAGTPVTQALRMQRASEVGQALCAHDRWKSHGHSISRDVLWSEIRLQIKHPDAALERATVRAWALCYWVFDKFPVHKMLVSQQYRYIKHQVTIGATA